MGSVVYGLHKNMYMIMYSQDCNILTTSERAIDTGVVLSKARREIVQVLRTLISMHTLYLLSEQYIGVSQKLVTK